MRGGMTHMSALSSLFLYGWNGSLPVAAWKNVAPTLHKSTCKCVQRTLYIHVQLNMLALLFLMRIKVVHSTVEQ